ncbi:sodium phosphate protein [Apiospora arundinis]
MTYPQANYQRLVCGEYPTATYRSACEDAVKRALQGGHGGYYPVTRYRSPGGSVVERALPRGDKWKYINSDEYTTLGAGKLRDDRYVAVRVKLRTSHAKERLDECALENALEQAAGTKIDIHLHTHESKNDMYKVRFEISMNDIHFINTSLCGVLLLWR